MLEGKHIYILKSGETSSIYLTYPLAALFNLDIYLRTIYCPGNPNQLTIIGNTFFLFFKLNAILIK